MRSSAKIISLFRGEQFQRMADGGIGDTPSIHRSRDHYDDAAMSTSTASIDSSIRARADIHQYLEIGKSLQHLRKSVFDMYRNDIKNGPTPLRDATPGMRKSFSPGDELDQSITQPQESNSGLVSAQLPTADGPVVGDTSVVRRKENRKRSGSAPSGSAMKTPSGVGPLAAVQQYDTGSAPPHPIDSFNQDQDGVVSAIHPSSSRQRAQWEQENSSAEPRSMNITPAALYNDYDGPHSPGSSRRSAAAGAMHGDDGDNDATSCSPARLNKSITDLVSQHEEKFKK